MDFGAVVEHSKSSPRKVGRPRKWGSEADRKRAYRQRLAADLDEPLRLRRAVRAEQRRNARLVERNARLEQRLQWTARRALDAEAELQLVNERCYWLTEDVANERRRADELAGQLKELRANLHRSHEEQVVRRQPSPSVAVRPLPPPPVVIRPRLTLAPMCAEAGCDGFAVVRVRGGRGIERDLCAAHARSRAHGRAGHVVRRY